MCFFLYRRNLSLNSTKIMYLKFIGNILYLRTPVFKLRPQH